MNLVSIIVPCRNEMDYIDSFITFVMDQSYLDFEVIIADGDSDDGTRDALECYKGIFPNLTVISNPERYVSTGLNRAIEVAKGTVLIRMDVHTEYAEDYVEQCVNALESSGAANVGGPARTKATGYLQRAICMAYHSSFAVGGARFHNVDYEGYVDTVTYGCWYKKTLKSIGLFDDELVRNQDDELNLRLVRQGEKIWQTPKIRSWYYPRSSLTALFKQYMQYGYWKVKVIQKHRLPASVRHLVPGLFVASIIVLSFLAPFIKSAIILLSILLISYAAASLVASMLASYKEKLWRVFPILPIVFAMYHIGYGSGFLKGIIDFNLLQRSSDHFSKITRSNGEK